MGWNYIVLLNYTLPVRNSTFTFPISFGVLFSGVVLEEVALVLRTTSSVSEVFNLFPSPNLYV
jgi:hypothetical protein